MKKLTFLILAFLLLSMNLPAQEWVPFGTLPGSGITAIKTDENGDLFVATASYNYPTGQNAGLYRSLSGNGALIDISPAPQLFNARAIDTEGSSLVLASCWPNPSLNQEALYRSTDNGSNWTRTYQIGTSNNIFSIKADPDNNNVYIGARNGVHKSTDNGLTFALSNSGMPSGSWTLDIDKANGKLFAATSNGLYMSTDLGLGWSEVSGIPQQDTPKSIAVIPTSGGERLIAGTDEGDIYISDESLALFSLVFGFDDSDIINMLVLFDFVQSDYHLIVSAFPKNFDNAGNGLYQSINSSNNFSNIGQGLPVPFRISAIAGTLQASVITAFAGTFNNTQNGAVIYRKDYSVRINSISTETPKSFALYQNYPNPFNPKTKIRFQVMKTAHVSIAVYSTTGTEISKPVNGQLNAGTYEAEFDGSGIPSGVYFYRMFIDGNTSESLTKKLILTK